MGYFRFTVDLSFAFIRSREGRLDCPLLPPQVESIVLCIAIENRIVGTSRGVGKYGTEDTPMTGTTNPNNRRSPIMRKIIVGIDGMTNARLYSPQSVLAGAAAGHRCLIYSSYRTC